MQSLGLGLSNSESGPMPVKRSWVLVKALILFAALAVLMFLFSRTAGAEETASAKLANAAMPSTVLFGTAPDCLEKVAKILRPKDAAKFCLEARGQEKERAKNAAKHASNAARSVVVYDGYGSGSWNYYPTSVVGYGGYIK